MAEPSAPDTDPTQPRGHADPAPVSREVDDGGTTARAATRSERYALARPSNGPRRLSPRITRWVAWLASIAVLGALLVDRATQVNCASRRATTIGSALSICQREYQETKDPTIGVWLAEALRQLNELAAAEALANELLATPSRADALRVLGSIANDRGHYEDAVAALERARAMHHSEHKPAGIARDNQMLAKVQIEHSRYAEALQALDDCLVATDDAAHGRDRREGQQLAYMCHLTADEALTRIGYLDLANQEIDRAAPLAASPSDLVWLAFQRGTHDQETARVPPYEGHHEQAILAFEQALALDARAHVPDLAVVLDLSLAYSLAEAHRTDDADRHLAAARLRDTAHRYEADITQVAARIAYRRGSLSLAYALNDQVYPTMAATEDTGDERIDVAVMQTRICLSQGDLVRAERWATRGADEVERIRAAQSAVELRPWVLSTRREPYELLFVTLARAGRSEDAAMVLDNLLGRALLDAMARPKRGVSLGLRDVAHRTEKLGTWLSAISSAPFAKTDRRTVLATLATTDVLALVVADGEIWRLASNRGQLRVDDLGPRTIWQERIDAFASNLGDRSRATALGDSLLPEATFRSTQPLHVLLDGPLSSWPVAALRREGRPLIAVRPIVRVLRLPDTPCIVPVRSGRRIVIADPTGSLPDARREAEEVAALLHAGTAVGPSATVKALLGAMDSAVLHLAVHGEADDAGGVIELADRKVSAPEISSRQVSPSLVVLLACDSAHSKDTELAGSLAAAFLAAGSDQVVATTRPIDDRATRQLAGRFYRSGGIADPVRALAAVQAELAEQPGEHANPDWPYFAVFGHDVCTRPP